MKRRSLLAWMFGAPIAAKVAQLPAAPAPVTWHSTVAAADYSFATQLAAKKRNFMASVMDLWDERDRDDYQTHDNT